MILRRNLRKGKEIKLYMYLYTASLWGSALQSKKNLWKSVKCLRVVETSSQSKTSQPLQVGLEEIVKITQNHWDKLNSFILKVMEEWEPVERCSHANKMAKAINFENNCSSFLQNQQSPPIHGGVSAQVWESMLYHSLLN